MQDSSQGVFVVGGGVAGMSAAKALHHWGYRVHLVEKEERPGGRAFDWACMATDACQNCGACLAAELVDQVMKLDRVQIYLKTSVAGIQIADSGFRVTLTGENRVTIEVKAILLATGFRPFDPSRLESLNYLSHDNVITTAELNGLLKDNTLADRLSDKETPKIAFIQCVGSRNRTLGKDYCSQVCCKTALRQAQKILYLMPQAELTVYYMDLQVIGKEVRTLFNHMKDRVTLLQGIPAEVLTGREPGKLSLIRADERRQAREIRHFDLIVLAVGIEPEEQTGTMARFAGAKTDPWGFFEGEGADLPEGVYVAGAAKAPTDIVSAKQQGFLSAYQIARDLGRFLPAYPGPAIAVLGSGHEGVTVSKGFSAAGFNVHLMDSECHGDRQGNGFVHHPDCRISSIEGALPGFSVRFTSKGRMKQIEASAIVVAEGIHTEPPAITRDTFKDRIKILPEFIALFEKSIQALPDRVVFWLDQAGPEWKAQSRRILHLATRLADTGRHASVLMKNMLVHGLVGQRAYDDARKAGVRFLRMLDPSCPQLHKDGEALGIDIQEATIPSETIRTDCDWLVIPAGVKPPGRASEIARILKDNLDQEGFLQSNNVRRRPVSGMRRGVLFAGGCHDETDDLDLEDEIRAIVADLDAIRYGATPEGRLGVRINENRCAKCLTCYRSCPHGAVVLAPLKTPRIVPEACFECGICVSACPALAIEYGQGSDGMLTEDVEEGKTVLFACERSAALAAQEAARWHPNSCEDVQMFTVRCAGLISKNLLLAPLLQGSRRVIVAACHDGNCRSDHGTRLAAKRVGQILKDAGLADSEIVFHRLAANEPVKYLEILSRSGECTRGRSE